MKVLIIDNFDSFTYNLAQIIRQSGLCDYEIIKYDRIDVEYIDDFQKILISPGPGLPKDYPDLYKVLNRYSGKKSILGVCLGHQLTAEYFGARLTNLNTVFHGVSKRIGILDSGDYLFQNIPDEFKGGLYHSWAVSEINFPSELRITSKDESGIIMSLSHKEKDIKGIQFHPESVMTKYGQQIIFNWLKN